MDSDKGGTLGSDEIKQLMDMLGMRVSVKGKGWGASTTSLPPEMVQWRWTVRWNITLCSLYTALHFFRAEIEHFISSARQAKNPFCLQHGPLLSYCQGICASIPLHLCTCEVKGAPVCPYCGRSPQNIVWADICQQRVTTLAGIRLWLRFLDTCYIITIPWHWGTCYITGRPLSRGV